MNYFAHALPFLDEPHIVAGTSTPDWLSVADSQVRVRARRTLPWVDSACPRTSAVARGLCQHLRDDARFHETRAFAETSMELSAAIRRLLGSEPDYRAAFLGHVLVEVLLDAVLVAENPAGLEAYYRALAAVDAQEIQDIINRIASRPTQRLAPFVDLFRRARILADYADDQRLLMRLNQVMRRVGFAPLPDELAEILPPARRLIARRRHELLDGIPAQLSPLEA